MAWTGPGPNHNIEHHKQLPLILHNPQLQLHALSTKLQPWMHMQIIDNMNMVQLTLCATMTASVNHAVAHSFPLPIGLMECILANNAQTPQ